MGRFAVWKTFTSPIGVHGRGKAISYALKPISPTGKLTSIPSIMR